MIGWKAGHTSGPLRHAKSYHRNNAVGRLKLARQPDLPDGAGKLVLVACSDTCADVAGAAFGVGRVLRDAYANYLWQGCETGSLLGVAL